MAAFANVNFISPDRKVAMIRVPAASEEILVNASPGAFVESDAAALLGKLAAKRSMVWGSDWTRQALQTRKAVIKR